MKRRIILWAAGILIFLMLVNCHWVAPPLRRADAIITVKTTGYCACQKCCSWRINWIGLPVYASGPLKGKIKIVGQTASTRIARPGTVAVDPKVFPPGTKFYIPGYGGGIARDTGGDIKGARLDLFFWRHQSAEDWGVQTKNIKVWYLRD